MVLNPALELVSVEVDSLCSGDTVFVDVLDVGNVTSYTWSPNQVITDNSIREPGFFPPLTQEYFLETINYCYLDRDTVTIGASLNILTDAISENAGGEISNSFGSYGTRKHTVKFTTGKINEHLEVSGRFSNIH